MDHQGVDRTSEDHEWLGALRDAFWNRSIPSPGFLQQVEEMGLRAIQRRKQLEKLDQALDSVPLQILLSDYVERLAFAADVSIEDAMVALGYDQNSPREELDRPSEKTAQAASLLCIQVEIAKCMMRAACLEEQCAIAALKESSGDLGRGYPMEEVQRRIDVAIQEGGRVKARLDRCEEEISKWFVHEG